MRKQLRNIALSGASVVALAGCAATAGPNEFHAYPDTNVVNQETPYDKALACLSDHIKENKRVPAYTIGVGSTRDATGKINMEDGQGNYVTQGWADMLYSALDQTDVYVLVERQNTAVIEWEHKWAEKKLLRDATNPRQTRQRIDTNGDGKGDSPVPWRVYRAGSFVGTDMIINGSINTLDLNVSSGGARARIYGVGPDARIYESVVGFDLRLVDTESTVIPWSETVKKKIVGYEVGAGAGLFLGTTLLDIQAGAKENEPLNLALREMTKLSVYNMTVNLYDVSDEADKRCSEHFEDVEKPQPKQTAQVDEPDSLADRNRFIDG